MKIYRDKNEGKSQCQYEKKMKIVKIDSICMWLNFEFIFSLSINYINTEMNEKFNKAFILII